MMEQKPYEEGSVLIMMDTEEHFEYDTYTMEKLAELAENREK